MGCKMCESIIFHKILLIHSIVLQMETQKGG